MASGGAAVDRQRQELPNLGFLGAYRLYDENKRKPLLDFLGFAWISLDSLVRIETYQWVMRDKRWNNFLRGLCRRDGRAAVEALGGA
jgi:hypothetical protein